MKLDRMLGILTMLTEKKRVKAKDLAQRFEVSLRDGFTLDKSALTPSEMQSIVLGLKSTFSLYNLRTDDGLKGMLSSALGVMVVVDKQRDLYVKDNVRFHLDTVQNLGAFIEIEANASASWKLLRRALADGPHHYVPDLQPPAVGSQNG